MAWYLKGLTGAARVKDVLMEHVKRDDMVHTLNDYVEHLMTTTAQEGSGTEEKSAILH
jgi:hypothetical protein